METLPISSPQQYDDPMGRFLKNLGYGLIAILVVYAFAYFLLLRRLPSPSELRTKMMTRKPAPPSVVQTLHPSETPALSEATPQGTPDPQQLAAKIDEVAKAKQAAINDYFMNRYLDGQSPEVDVCNHLKYAPDPTLEDKSIFGETLYQVAVREKPGDPYLEGFLAPVSYAVGRPKMKELIQTVRGATDSGDQGILKKAAFYSQVALAAADLLSNRAEIERISDHAYDLLILTRALKANPRMIDDPASRDLCERIQARINIKPEGSTDEEKAELSQFLERAGVTPAQVDFDPKYRSKITIESGKNGIRLRIPWMEKYLGAPEGHAESAR